MSSPQVAATWPLVGLVPDLKVRGWKGIGPIQSALEVVRMDEALKRRDVGEGACLVSYFVPGEARMPRLSKGAEHYVRSQGGELLTGALVMDYDLPKDGDGQKQEWSRVLFDEFLDRLATASTVVPELEHPHAFYRTRHGARMIWVYEEPVSVERGEAFAKSFHRRCLRAGLEFDEAALDWTRLSRLPYAPSGHDPELVLEYEAPRLKPQDGPVTAPLPRVVRVQAPRLRPNEADVAAVVGSDWWMQAKSALEPTKYHDPLYTADHGPLTQPGERNATFMKFVGAVLHYVRDLPGTTPTHIYAVMHAAAEAAYASCPEGEDWRETVWGMVQRVCDQDGVSAELAAERAEQSRSRIGRLLRGVREWCTDSSLAAALAGPEEEALAVVKRHAILNLPGSNQRHVLGQDGYFDSVPLRGHPALVGRIRELGQEWLVPVRVPRADGKGMRLCTEAELAEQFMTSVSRIEARADIPGAYVERLGTRSATLVMRTYELRKDLEPRFDPEVDEWLRHFFGRHYDEGVRWIAHALDLGDPIAGLSLKGPPACGKKLLAQGLAECIDTECYLDSSVLGQWSEGLLRSPLVVVNEGLPSSLPGVKTFADRLRDLIGGDPIAIQEKYRSTVTFRGAVRVIFTANDHEILHALGRGRDMTRETRRSLAQRVIHFDLPDGAGTWLASKGGKAWTAQPGRRWIRGDSGQASDYVVAKHFLWLFENRSRWPADTGRLLVEGDTEAGWAQSLALVSDGAALALEGIYRLLTTYAEGRAALGPEVDLSASGVWVDEEAGRVWVTQGGVRDVVKSDFRSPSSRAIAAVLRNLSTNGRASSTRKGKARQARWWELDLTETFLERARETDADPKAIALLEQLLEAREAA